MKNDNLVFKIQTVLKGGYFDTLSSHSVESKKAISWLKLSSRSETLTRVKIFIVESNHVGRAQR